PGWGGLVGALLSLPLGLRLGSGRTVIGAHLLSAAGVLALLVAAAVGPQPVVLILLCLGQALHGLAIGASNSHEMAYRQQITPDELQARTHTTMRWMNRAGGGLLAPVAAVLAARAGGPPGPAGGAA